MISPTAGAKRLGRTSNWPANHTLTITSTRPRAFPMRVSLKQEKPPQTRGLLSSLAPGKKERLKFVWGLR